MNIEYTISCHLIPHADTNIISSPDKELKSQTSNGVHLVQ